MINYIELFGINCSGKSYINDKIIQKYKNKKIKISTKKKVVLNFYYKNIKKSFFKQFFCYFYLLYLSDIFYFLRKKLRRNNNIFIQHNSKRINFYQKKIFLHHLIDKLGFNIFYNQVLNELELKLNLKKKKFYKLFLKQVNKNHKLSKIKKWFLENIITFEIQKKSGEKNICILDEGIIQNLFCIFLLNNNVFFLKNFLKDFKMVGQVYLINSKKKTILKRSKKRNLENGFRYQDVNQINQFLKFLRVFKKIIKNKISYKIINN